MHINGIHEKLYAGAKHAKPNNLIKNQRLKPNPVTKELSIIVLIFLFVYLILPVSIPDVIIKMVLTNSNQTKNMNNPL